MLRARSLWGLPLCALLSACTYGEHHYETTDPVVIEGPECRGPVRQGTIDTDGLIEVDAAEGVGVFVEYEANGRWHVFSSCDSNISGHDCLFDVVVHPVGTGGILGVSAESLEADDTVSLAGADAVQMVSYTDYDFDGFYVDTDPGTGLSVDVLLDDQCAASYVYWVGGGAVHDGAPSTPFELVPSSP
jgi:hypothetical protein